MTIIYQSLFAILLRLYIDCQLYTSHHGNDKEHVLTYISNRKICHMHRPMFPHHVHIVAQTLIIGHVALFKTAGNNDHVYMM